MALTVTAGNPATAAQYNALIPGYYLQGSDQALSTTTLTNHNTFAALPFAADTTWHVVCNLAVYAANAGNDIKHIWNVTGGSAISQVAQISQFTSVAAIGDSSFTGLMYGNTNVSSSGTYTNGTYAGLVRLEFIVVTTGASGTVTLQWAQNAAVSGSTTVKAGSFLVTHRLV